MAKYKLATEIISGGGGGEPDAAPTGTTPAQEAVVLQSFHTGESALIRKMSYCRSHCGYVISGKKLREHTRVHCKSKGPESEELLAELKSLCRMVRLKRPLRKGQRISLDDIVDPQVFDHPPREGGGDVDQLSVAVGVERGEAEDLVEPCPFPSSPQEAIPLSGDRKKSMCFYANMNMQSPAFILRHPKLVRVLAEFSAFLEIHNHEAAQKKRIRRNANLLFYMHIQEIGNSDIDLMHIINHLYQILCTFCKMTSGNGTMKNKTREKYARSITHHFCRFISLYKAQNPSSTEASNIDCTFLKNIGDTCLRIIATDRHNDDAFEHIQTMKERVYVPFTKIVEFLEGAYCQSWYEAALSVMQGQDTPLRPSFISAIRMRNVVMTMMTLASARRSLEIVSLTLKDVQEARILDIEGEKICFIQAKQHKTKEKFTCNIPLRENVMTMLKCYIEHYRQYLCIKVACSPEEDYLFISSSNPSSNLTKMSYSAFNKCINSTFKDRAGMGMKMCSRYARYSLASSGRRYGLHLDDLKCLSTLMCHSKKTADRYYDVGADNLNRKLFESLLKVEKAAKNILAADSSAPAPATSSADDSTSSNSNNNNNNSSSSSSTTSNNSRRTTTTTTTTTTIITTTELNQDEKEIERIEEVLDLSCIENDDDEIDSLLFGPLT